MNKPQRQSTGALLLLAIATLLTSPTLAGTESEAPKTDHGHVWQQWGGPNRDFRLAGKLSDGVLDLKQIWRRKLGGGHAAIVGDERHLFVHHRDAGDDVLEAIEATTGERVWESRLRSPAASFMIPEYGPGPHASPALAPNLVITIGSTGTLAVRSRANGDWVWRRELWTGLGGTKLERGYASSPLVFENLVVALVGGSSGSVVAFDLETGETVWSALEGAVAYASPVLASVDGERILVALLEKQLVGIHPPTGELLWTFPVNDRRYAICASPVAVKPDHIYFTDRDGGHLLHMNRSTSGVEVRELWRYKGIGSQVGNVVYRNGLVYGTRGSSTSFFVAVDGDTGELVWRDRKIQDSTVVSVGDRDLVLTDGGLLYEATVSRDGLELLKRHRVLSSRSWTAPSVFGSFLVVRNESEIAAYSF